MAFRLRILVGVLRNRKSKSTVAIGVKSMGCAFLMLMLAACARPDPPPGFPRAFVWAWERPEDLHWLGPRTTGVAFLARTVCLRNDGVGVRPHMQPLRVPPGTVLMAAVRVETGGRAAHANPAPMAEAIADGAAIPNARAAGGFRCRGQ